MANAQADRVRQLEDQLEQLRMNQDPLGKLDEEVRDLEAQGAKEREKKKAEEAEAQRRKQQEQEELVQKRKRETEAQATCEASAQADKARKRKRWEEYKASWSRFRALTSEAALFHSVQEIVPWPTDSGRFPGNFNEAEIKLFFVTGASFDGCPARKTFAEERKRWHPNNMNRYIMQKKKEVSGNTCKAITAIAQILNELCLT
jgi:hypothetical protein